MRWLVPVSFLVPLTITASAYAGDNCPPGSWFCESVSIGGGGDDDAASAPKSKPSDDLATSPDDSPGTKPKTRKPPVDDEGEIDTPSGEPDTVVIVKKRRHPRERVMLVREEVPQRRLRERRWREHFGMQLRVEGAAFAPRNGEVVGLGGAGASFRWRPSPYFAFDLGADIVGGKDYDHNDRVEFAGSLSGLLFFNPQHRVQVYAIGGIHLSHAAVGTNCYDYGYDNRYGGGTYDYVCQSAAERNYFGGQGGMGIEFRVARHFGLFIDALAIIRTRIDSEEAEFRDPNTGEQSNTSGAGLFRAGVNFWW